MIVTICHLQFIHNHFTNFVFTVYVLIYLKIKIIFFRQEDKKKQNRFKIRLKIGLRILLNTKFMKNMNYLLYVVDNNPWSTGAGGVYELQ